MAKSQNQLSFSIDARTIIQLGRDSIKNPTTALLELVKNSYDADATIVQVEVRSDSIRVSDNGTGMTTDQLENNWLRIGFSEKKTNKVTPTSRRKTGEKGIGRLSTDRLGSNLLLRTKSSSGVAVGLEVDWDSFDVDGRDLSEVPIYISPTSTVEVPPSKGKTGTEILITGLRQTWLATEIEQVYSELGALISPFAKVKDFEIIFSNEVLPELNGRIESAYYEVAELSLRAMFDDESQELSYSIVRAADNGSKGTTERISWTKLSNLLDKNIDYSSKLSCGPTSIELLFFARSEANPLMKAKGLTLRGLRDFLDNNQGVKIYRDNISVKPYGYNKEPAGDWLGLAQRKEREPAAINRPTWRVSSYQLIGAVSIGRDLNELLRDGASREGLVENTSFNDLRALTLACVLLLERQRFLDVKEEREREAATEKETAVEAVDAFRDDLEELKENLEDLKDKLKDDKTNNAGVSIAGELEEVIKKTNAAKRKVEDLLNNNRVLSGLATIGISAAVFGHETQAAISAFQSAVYVAQSSLKSKAGPNIPQALENLDLSLKSAKQVASWGAFAISRVRKDKRVRQKVSITNAVEGILMEIQDAFSAINIQLDTKLEDIDAEVFVMDIESILLNLLTNAYAFCSRTSVRKIRVELNKKTNNNISGFEIVVADSGPGVDELLKDMIWEPLFTTRRDSAGREEGTGLGLSIVSSTASELRGNYGVSKDKELGGARFQVWLPSNV